MTTVAKKGLEAALELAADERERIVVELTASPTRDDGLQIRLKLGVGAE